jgi:hypothetical protein
MAAGGGRVIAKRFRVAWDGTNYIDESANLIDANGKGQFSAPGAAIMASSGMVATMAVTLHNNSRRYSVLNTGSTIYSSIAGGGAYLRPCTFDIAIDGGAWVRVFTGVIKEMAETVLAVDLSPVVKLTCNGRDELLLNRRLSSTLYRQTDEAAIITAWLTAAGVAGGDMAIDTGLMTINEAWLDDEPVTSDAWQLAAACGGRFYCNADGKYCYENAQHWLFSPYTTSQQTYAWHYRSCSLKHQDSDLYSDITVEANVRSADAAGELWTPDDPITVPAGQSRTVTAQFRYPAASVSGTTWSAVTAGGMNLGAAVSMSSANYYAQRAILTFSNSSAYQAVLQGLVISGVPLVGGPRHEESAASANSFWTNRARRSRRLSNVYVQSQGQARMLAAMLKDWSELPRLFFKLENAVGNPARRLGDRITLNDSGAGASQDAFITGIAWRYSASAGFTQTLDCVAASNLYPYGVTPGYFILGTHTAGASSRRIFY